MLYQSTMFKVEIDGQQSEWKHQATGIRQRYPLSQYLFLLVMTVLMHDIKENKPTRTNLEENRIQGSMFDEILFADDTIIFSENLKT